MDIRSLNDYIRMRNRYSDIKEDELVIGATLDQQKAIDSVKAQYGGSYIKKLNEIKNEYYNDLHGGSWKDWFQQTFGRQEKTKQITTEVKKTTIPVIEKQIVKTNTTTNPNVKALVDTIINGLDKKTYTVDEVKMLLRIVYNS